MCRLKLFILFLFLIGESTRTQTDENSINIFIEQHKRLDIAKMETQLGNIKSFKLRQLLSYDLAYLKDGTIVPTINLNLDGLEKRDNYVGRYVLANLKQREDKKGGKHILTEYKMALSDALKQKDTLVINEILKRVNTYLFLNGMELDIYSSYINKHEEFARDSIDQYHLTFHRIGLEFLKNESNPSNVDTEMVSKLFKIATLNATTPYLLGKIFNFQSIFYSACLQDQKLAKEYSDMAFREFSKETHFFSQDAINGILFNNAVNFHEEGKFSEAIPIFKKVLKREKQLVYRMHGYDWLHKCYDSIGDFGNAYRYFKKVGEVKDSLSLLEHAREIKAIEAQYNFAEKERELEQLANEKDRVQTNFNTLVPFFGIALVLALITIFLYRKYRKRSRLLQEEKKETLKQIDKLKKIVIKNHIILKDKTKVYISDLIYLKAEDHYLKLFLSNKKDHLVRGKIKEIKQQLPPNFIQCHRSYIVNANFIKQANGDNLIMIGGDSIPISRTYKGNL